MIDLKELKRLAEGATQGIEHWDTEKPASDIWKQDHIANAAYMRKANPSVVLQLIKEHQEMREAFESILSRGDYNPSFMREVARQTLDGVSK